MLHVISKIIINKPVHIVAEFAMEPDNAIKWYDNIYSVEWISPKPLEKSSLIAFKARFLGKELSYTYKIIDLSKDKKLTMTTDEGPFPMETSYSWNKVSESKTEMILENKGKPSGFSLFLTPFMKTANRKDLQKLKAILEKI